MREISIVAAMMLGLSPTYAQNVGGEQPRRLSATEVNMQLLENDLRNYRSAAAQLSEKNQQLTDEVDALKKKLGDELAALKRQCPAEK